MTQLAPPLNATVGADAPPWFGKLDTGGLPPEPPIEAPGEPWRPDDNWWLMLALGVQICIVAYAIIIDVMERRGFHRL